jgi:hypothetical protein
LVVTGGVGIGGDLFVGGVIDTASYIEMSNITAAGPGSAGSNRLYFDTTDTKLKSINSSSVVTVYQPTTTKGDITVHNGTTQVRLPVGTNYQLPFANSTASTGIAWGGLTAYTVNASNSVINTTSTTYVVMTGMTITAPTPGTYIVWAGVHVGNNANNFSTTIGIFVNGTIVTNSGWDHPQQGATTIDFTYAFNGIITVTTGDVDMRWFVTGNTGRSDDRAMTLLRIA